ncbi:5'-nucleotidase C-terminal domain-containing protein [Flavobacterium crassostreae]|uniref:5'-nucleotidase C-terminal domain-containing protein n=1 Tax=Flavobacterium crassostreae TaxID=1763534 RepID=UPI003CE4C254
MKLFVIFLTFFGILSCGNKIGALTKIEGKQIAITPETALMPQEGSSSAIEAYIKPYREHINKDLDSVLSYCPVTLDKKVTNLQSTLGNLMADVVLKAGNAVFWKKEQKEIALCLLNSGGIRAILPKGNVTARNAFEIMPFENNLVVIALTGDQILDLIAYFIATKKAHPLSGLTFRITKDNLAETILIQGKPLYKEQLYYVATNDYLANGGDNMTFFAKGSKPYDLNYKLRNIWLDYFKQTDTITGYIDQRISVE